MSPKTEAKTGTETPVDYKVLSEDLQKQNKELVKKLEDSEAELLESKSKTENLQKDHDVLSEILKEKTEDLQKKEDEISVLLNEKEEKNNFAEYEQAIIESRQASQEFRKKREDADLLVKTFIKNLDEILK